jgi:hypothetical protein
VPVVCNVGNDSHVRNLGCCAQMGQSEPRPATLTLAPLPRV